MALEAAQTETEYFAGVFATLKSSAVALFTLLSVACAERMTDTSNSNGVAYFNSVVGTGLTRRRRLKISARCELFIKTIYKNNSHLVSTPKCNPD